MNPDKNYRRGCFIRNDGETAFTVVDYPTWTFNKYGEFFKGQNAPLPEGSETEKTFQSKAEAYAFCAAENMVVCAAPGSKPAYTPIEDDIDED